jgi:hypothetical protein
MAFFKSYKGTTNRRLVRLERLIWTLIYGGLLALVLGYFVENTQGADGTALYAIGLLVAAMGVVLVYVRSRLREEG